MSKLLKLLSGDVKADLSKFVDTEQKTAENIANDIDQKVNSGKSIFSAALEAISEGAKSKAYITQLLQLYGEDKLMMMLYDDCLIQLIQRYESEV